MNVAYFSFCINCCYQYACLLILYDVHNNVFVAIISNNEIIIITAFVWHQSVETEARSNEQ